MSENSKIQWCDHTFNPWWGCAKISPACDHCYAEPLAALHFPKVKLWGAEAARRTFDAWAQHWRAPHRWNRRAEKVGTRARVFCASMADVFESHPAVEESRELLFETIRRTPWLDWLILTKRIGNVKRMVPSDWGDGYPNVWLGISVCNQIEAERDIPKLLATPAEIRFLSCEPMIGPIALAEWIGLVPAIVEWRPRVDWVIVGGESGPKARPFNIEWARAIVADCRRSAVPPFVKQLGAKPFLHRQSSLTSSGPGYRLSANLAEIDMEIPLIDRKGGSWEEWPADLRVREFPKVLSA